MISMDTWQGQETDKALLDECRQAIRRVVPDADVILYGSRPGEMLRNTPITTSSFSWMSR